MPIDFTKPATTGNYSTGVLQPINDAMKALAQLLDPAVAGTVTSPPSGAKRLNSGLFESWNGTSWVEQAMAYAKKAGDTFTGTINGTVVSLAQNGGGFVQKTTSTSGYAGLSVQNSAGTRRLELLYLDSAHGGVYGAASGDSVLNALTNKIVFATADTARMSIGSAGLVGIGRTASTGLLELEHASDTRLYLYTAGNGRGGLRSTSSLLSLRTISNVPLTFEINSVEVARLDTSGNFGIGAVSGGAKLHVAGYGRFNHATGVIAADAGVDYLSMWKSGGRAKLEAWGGLSLGLCAGSAEVVTVGADGFVGIGMTGTRKLHVAGAALTAASPVAFSATPTIDARLSNFFTFGTLTANVTSMTISNPIGAQFVTLRFKQDGTGGRTVAPPAGAKVSGSVQAAAGSVSYLNIAYSADDARWEGAWMPVPL